MDHLMIRVAQEGRCLYNALLLRAAATRDEKTLVVLNEIFAMPEFLALQRALDRIACQYAPRGVKCD